MEKTLARMEEEEVPPTSAALRAVLQCFEASASANCGDRQRLAKRAEAAFRKYTSGSDGFWVHAC